MELMPQEIEVRYILPTIRRELSLEIYKKGKSQKEIAMMLKITPAAISQYIKSKRASYISLSNNKNIKESVKNILENNANPHEEMYRLSKLFVEDKTICKIHKQFDKHVKEDCNLCIKK